MPLAFSSGEKYEGQSQQATATWILVFWAETPIISEPRQAIGRM
jgi:hypothetical protein